ncbi:MAG: CYTH domain-containing protein [Saccharofermentanales bacterium]
METEIKLRFLEPNGKEQILSNKWIKSLEMPDSMTVKEFKNVYYDTVDRILEKENAVFRIRNDGEGLCVATVKIGKSVSEGLHQRLEWNVEQEDDQVDIRYFRKMAESDGDPEEYLIDLLDKIEDKELIEICSTQFERTTVHLGYEDTLVELACDYGIYKADKREQPFAELEIELIEGDARALLDLGEEISRIVPVVPENKSKYGRCIELAKREED